MADPMPRDDWTMAFAEVLIAAGRPKKVARQVALSEWVSRPDDKPERVARDWLRKQEKP